MQITSAILLFYTVTKLKKFGKIMQTVVPMFLAAGSAKRGVERTQPVISADDWSRAGGEQHH